MNRSISSLVACTVVSLVAVAAYPTEAKAQVVYYPPAEYVASYTPYYWNGHPHYFYRNHWYYRDHGAWRGYDHEPGFLWDHRGEWGGHYHHWR